MAIVKPRQGQRRVEIGLLMAGLSPNVSLEGRVLDSPLCHVDMGTLFQL